MVACSVLGPSCEINIDDCNHDNCNYGDCIDGIDSFTCDCHPGYEGEFCNTEINECDRYRPCKNNAVCTDLVADYSCKCAVTGPSQPQYAGKNCTFELTSCQGNLCQNGATCRPYLIDEATAQQDYECLCTHGYTGKYCNVSTTMSFDISGSYIKQDLTDLSNVSLSFRFRTTLKNSILFAWTGSGESGLFLTFELKDGSLLLQFHDVYANDGQEIKTINGASAFNDGHWHQVDLEKTDAVKVKVTSPNCVSDISCMINTNFQVYANDTPTTDIRFGTVADSVSVNSTASETPFVGCMQDVTVVGNKLVLSAASPDFFLIAHGCPRVEQCSPDPCNGKGVCIDLWNKYECDCRRPYLGTNCEFGKFYNEVK